MKECFVTRGLRYDRPDYLKAEKSLEVAARKLEEAQKLADANFENNALLNAYASMFHSGRALLFKDGVIEKSHYCLIAYLQEEYAQKDIIETGIITLMDSFRQERHDVLYSLESMEIGKEDVAEALANAKKLLAVAKKILKNNK